MRKAHQLTSERRDPLLSTSSALQLVRDCERLIELEGKLPAILRGRLAGRDGTVKLWDAAGTLLGMLRTGQGEVYEVVFHPDGKRLASAGADGTVKIWAAP